MSIFKRLSDIVSANLHAMLDRAEDPERMLAQIIREMEAGLAEARRQAARAIAAERRLGREAAQHRAATEHWKNKAREALVAQREDLARRALVRRREHDDLARALDAQHAEALQTSAKLRTSLRALEARLAEARRKERALVARHRAALARAEVQKNAGLRIEIDGSWQRFSALENRLTEFEDELAVEAELSQPDADIADELAALARDHRIEEELEELKKDQSAAGLGVPA